ncbi:hypothetical protein LCGC14_1755690 [marine sediment metagenome]|uniref:Uncharacterized protein n=1 Tax=marine sediment metagenome TaxID=412755 RepID=A0A0F9K268_9ZZZZ
MSLTRDAIITEVMTETKRTDKQTYLENVFSDVMHDMSTAMTEDGDPIPLQDLKKPGGTLTLADGDYYKDLPSDFVFLYGVPELLYDTDKGRQLIKKSIEWLDFNYPNRANNTSNKTKPRFFSLENNRFDFAPMSDAVYTVNFPYTVLHETVDSNSVAISFKDYFKPVIKDWLKAKLWELFKDNDERDFYLLKGLNKLKSLAVIGKRNSSEGLITEYNDY